MDSSSENTPPPPDDSSRTSGERAPGTDGVRYNPVERAKAKHLCRQLQMRLQYARLKVEHGWVGQDFEEVENLYFHQTKASGSPSPQPSSKSSNKRKRAHNPYPDPSPMPGVGSAGARPTAFRRDSQSTTPTTEMATSLLRQGQSQTQQSPLDNWSPPSSAASPAHPPNRRKLSFPRPSASPAPAVLGSVQILTEVEKPSAAAAAAASLCPISEERSTDTRPHLESQGASPPRKVPYPLHALHPVYEARPEAQIDPALQELSVQTQVSRTPPTPTESTEPSRPASVVASQLSTPNTIASAVSPPPVTPDGVVPAQSSFQTFKIAKPTGAAAAAPHPSPPVPAHEVANPPQASTAGVPTTNEHPRPSSFNSPAQPVPGHLLSAQPTSLAPAAQITSGTGTELSAQAISSTTAEATVVVPTTTPPLPDADSAPRVSKVEGEGEGENSGCHLVIPTFSYGDPSLTYDSFWTTHGMGKAVPGNL